MKHEETQIGELITNGEVRRDAVHVAVAPVTASENLKPGQRIGFIDPANTELAGLVSESTGIVDPFLQDPVKKGERFWMFLFPGMVTGMRHSWRHPAFEQAAALRRKTP